MNVLVLDVGTSSMRGVLYNGDGKPQFVHRALYSVKSAGKIVEQSPHDWESALLEICQKAAGAAREPVGALSLTSQRSSVIPVDAKGRPLRDAIMWQDTRSAGIVSRLAPCAPRIAAVTGARLNTVFSGTKMIWFRENEPELYAKTHKLCTVADYLVWLMTGEFVTDETYGSRSLLMGLASRRWESELLELFELDEARLCRILAPGSVAGRLTPAFARLTGLPAGIPLISAGGDQQCGALGQGLYRTGGLTVTFGTSACLLMQADTIPQELNGVICGAHAVPGRYVLEGSMLTCGAMIDWVRRTLLENADHAAVDRAVAASAPGANGVTVVPHFQGSGTPNWNSAVRGAFLNLNLGTTRADMVRAALESIVYEVVNNIEMMEMMGGPVHTLCVGGGLTQNPRLCQILADASGKIVLHGAQTAEDTAFGAWMSAAVTLGLRKDYAQAFESVEAKPEQIEPNSRNFGIYRQGRARMNEAYALLYPKQGQ